MLHLRGYHWQRFFFAASAAWLLLSSSVAAESVDGFTEPFRKIELAPAEPGTLGYLAVKEGDPVTKGQLLGGLECEVLQVTLEIAQATSRFTGRLDSAIAERICVICPRKARNLADPRTRQRRRSTAPPNGP